MTQNETAHAIVVHGHGVDSNGNPDAHGKQRVETGVELYDTDQAPHMIFTGYHSFLTAPPAVSEAEAMRQYALTRGVPHAAATVEEQSLETVGNVLLTTQNVLVPKGWDRIVVVTSISHLARTLGIWRHVLGPDFNITGVPAPETVGLKQRLWEPVGAAMVREILRGTKPGDLDAIQARLFSLVPGYDPASGASVSTLALKSVTGLPRKG